MHSEEYFRNIVEAELGKINPANGASGLYEPIRYMIGLGGKRFRPSLLLMSHEMFGGNPDEMLRPALGIEVFHNFTLLHDDIMDKAPLRRAKETVHKKWNPDVAILSGDAMFVQSCQLMMHVNDKYLRNVLDIFLSTAFKVCEGQQLDMDFENEETVSINDYLEMIGMKTASLIGCSAYIGTLCAGAESDDAKRMYEFGKNLGIAFQLHDDILDVYGDEKKFGKQVGGDILSNKKTILLLSAFQKANGKLKSDLQEWNRRKNFDPQEKIDAVVTIYDTLDVRRHATEKMESYFRKALDEIEAVKISSEKKETLLDLAERLMIRER